MKKIILAGCGAMGGAILTGCLAKGVWKKEEVYLKEHSQQASREKAARFGVSYIATAEDLEGADLVVIAVKPDVVPSVLKELSPAHPARVLSIAAAVTLDTLAKGLPAGTEIIRVMPNTPASVGEGMTAIAPGPSASRAFVAEAEEIFQALGKSAVVTERQLDELGAISGCGPAYAFVIIDALADAGVLVGLPRKLAIQAAAQTLYGAAKMVLDTGEHPAVLRDQVESPGGTTIEAVHVMEKEGLRSALADGVVAAMDKTDKMAGK